MRAGTGTAVAQPVPGIRGELGARKFTPTDLPALQSYLESPIEPSLTDSLLSDAQSALFEGSLLRSVLELAIAAEVLVKRQFFAEASPAGAAFDYLENRARVSVRVLELLDSVAAEAYGRSYKKEEPGHYQAIDNLFRCRNKIANRGLLAFRDDSGILVSVDASTVQAWRHAIDHLRKWLASL